MLMLKLLSNSTARSPLAQRGSPFGAATPAPSGGAPVRRACRAAAMAEATDPGAEARALLPLLPDAHAHPQLDREHAVAGTAALRVPRVAAMGVAANVDWGGVEALARELGDKVIPGFGIHPWWAHLHASEVGATWEELLEGPSPEEVARAVRILEGRRREDAGGGESAAARRYEEGRGGPAGAGQEGSEESEESDGRGGSRSRSERGGEATTSGRGEGGGGGPLDVVPRAAWRARLGALLSAHPSSIVGEVGIDRSAVIPGSRARVRFDHQLALLREQLALAARHGRPVSVHCVRGYGHLLQLLASLPREGGCPPAVMLHSYGGSPEDVARFVALPGVGPRVFFSFSSAINGRNPDKLAARIRAVPDDRLLLESDQVTPLLVEDGMARICAVAAAAKGWGLEEAAARARSNFDAFYGGASV